MDYESGLGFSMDYQSIFGSLHGLLVNFSSGRLDGLKSDFWLPALSLAPDEPFSSSFLSASSAVSDHGQVHISKMDARAHPHRPEPLLQAPLRPVSQGQSHHHRSRRQDGPEPQQPRHEALQSRIP